MASKRPETSTTSKRDDLVSAFDALALSGGQRDPSSPSADKVLRRKVPNKEGGFVGGFTPFNFMGGGSAYATTDGWKPSAFRRTTEDNGPSRPFNFGGGMPSPNQMPGPPPTISMPIPDGQQSLTMQHALGTPPRPNGGLMPPYPQTPPSRPQSESVLSPPSYQSSSYNASPSPPKVDVQTTPGRPRASSVPLSPTTPSKTGTVQCSGVTKAGKQCTRQVKAATPLSTVHPDAQIERFCHQHAKELLSVAGFYSHKVVNEYIKFEDWVPEYLQPETQVALRVEMEKPRSQADVPGYIYTFEIRDPKTPKKVHLKVGRAVNLVKRIDQWGKQCGSKEQVLRGWWPGTVEDEDGDPAANVSLMKGRVKAGDKGPLCHRLERLVHLELADLAANAPYLDPDYPNNISKKDVSSSGTPSKKPPASPAAKKLLEKPCADCGTVHKEIFSLTRPERGRYKGKEWDGIVKPVIEKWGGFVSAYV